MLGNVGEWCWDLYAPFGSAGETDPVGPLSTKDPRRVVRGGSFSMSAGTCRLASRRREVGTSGIKDVGFRPSRTAP